MVNISIGELCLKLEGGKKKGSWILVNSFLSTRGSGEAFQNRLLLKDCRGLTKHCRGLKKEGNTIPASESG